MYFSLSERKSGEIHKLNSNQVTNWSEDIDFFHSQLEQSHIDLYHSTSEEDFETELSSLKAALPNYNKHQVMVEMMRITRLIDDGHSLFGYWGNGYSRFPVYFRMFGTELRVIKTTPEYSGLLGKKLISIDGIESNNLIKKVSPVVQGVDNLHSLNHFLPYTLNVAEVLYGLKITKQLNIANFKFTDDYGNHQSVTLKSLPKNKLNLVTATLNERPVNLGKPLESTDGLWLSADIETKTAYIKLIAILVL